LVLELLSVFLLAAVLWRPRRNLITRTETVALTLPVVVPLLYLIPLPAELVERLPGRALYLDGRALLVGEKEDGPLRLSLLSTAYARGTYTNVNHLAGLLEMLLPIALALLIYSIKRGDISGGRGWKRRMTFFASTWGHTAFVYGAIAMLLLVGIIFTRSRTGIALSTLALLLSIMAFARRIGGTRRSSPWR